MRYCLSLVGTLLIAEPSAFDLQSGATKQELNTLKSSNKNLQDILTTLKSQTDTLLQGQDGLKSLVEGQALKLKGATDTLVVHANTLKTLKSMQDMQTNLLKQQADLINNLKSQIQANQAALAAFEKKTDDTNKLLAQMHTEFATKLQALQKSIDEQASINTQKLKDLTAIQEQMLQMKTKQNAPSFDKDPSKKEAIAREGLELFRQKQYAQAKVRFVWLANLPYRPAYYAYLAGEAAYMDNAYKEAIELFKKSALIQDKTSYMPILLWHTAFAFRALKDWTNYHKFLRSLVELYPESPQGKKAQVILEEKTKTR
ncbi:hypothetical protein [Helicobacter suis]|uniref:hypothetical protein n=1 Tax=Helicobacter suis TaxID=104628 RepID=UPI0013D4419E|nr:hypothetical protein [Helicobacter suis]